MRINRTIYSLFVFSLFLACEPDQTEVQNSHEENLSEIERIEKEEGIILFKKTFSFNDAENSALLTVASRKEEFFNTLISEVDFEITPIFKGQLLPKVGTSQAVAREIDQIKGEQIITEVYESKRGDNVIGFLVTTKSRANFTNGKSKLSGYEAYVTHTCGQNWPSQFILTLPNSGAGVHFDRKSKWYNSWVSDTNCIIGSSCGVGLNNCATDFDLFGTCSYTWDVDGPYRVRVDIGYYVPESDGWSYAFTY